MTIDRVSSILNIPTKKKFFQPYSYSKGMTQDKNDYYLVKPLTYMNNSGIIFPKLFRTTRMQESGLIVICDNMDLTSGVIRVKAGGSDAGHNGLKSIIETIHKEDFLRIYIGIGRPEPGCPVIEHVLGIPDNPGKLHEGIELASSAIIKLIEGISIHRVMNEFNRKNFRT